MGLIASGYCITDCILQALRPLKSKTDNKEAVLKSNIRTANLVMELQETRVHLPVSNSSTALQTL
ncbi:hypothetical protein M514_21742 [Trichuris suis]|uniref:Uncharacterized protein n=1 Tax=Trichuris suis TaxID=68888 RepID=A0A085N9C0_9BILA|nr:hypothetical protein M514_21742 [Trichuris suis]